MRTSHKLTRLFFSLAALVVLAASALAGPAPTNIGVSDQKAGSFLAFPYYTSLGTSDTRLTISNTGDKSVAVHMFFIGANCEQADQTICLTANASASFLASEYDPSNSGYLLAVAVDGNATLASGAANPNVGCPIQYNGLIGNAFVKDGANVGNYGAEAFWAYSDAPAVCDLVNWKATLSFNGTTGYDRQPNQFVAEIQSPNDATGQKIQMASIRGEVGGTMLGSAQEGIGVAYNDGEKPGSYSNPFGSGCLRSFTIDTKTPRVPGGLGTQVGVNNNALIPGGRTGTLKWNTSGSVGLISTPNTNKWSGIRTLHKTGVATNNSLIIPIFSSAAC
jgi:hypothetical protein